MKAILINCGIIIKCEPCGTHIIPVPQWTYNNNPQKPTCTPSVSITCNPPTHKNYQPQAQTSKCHFFITDGNIIYCSDCTHSLAAQTKELQEWTPEQIKFYNEALGYH